MKDFEKKFIWLPSSLRQTLDAIRWFLLSLRRQHSYYERSQRREFFRRAFVALGFNKIDGDYVEFGCHGGTTFGLAYHEATRIGRICKYWGFDSFAGLPAQSAPEDEHPEWITGTMRTGLDDFHLLCRYNRIPRSAYEVVPGYYEVSLVDESLSGRLPSNISLAFIDCDLYSSTLTVLNFLLPRLKHGMILAFDDYYCWSDSQSSGERRACAAIFSHHKDWALVPYVQFGWAGMSFVVESKHLMATAGVGY